jgi:type II secretory pathway pseudopilin PulG
MKKQERGISIIDLMVVVAIVSVLSTLIVTQLATFAVRTENATAVADLRAIAAVQKIMKANWHHYGRSAIGPIPGNCSFGSGNILMGPSSPELNPTILTTTDILGWCRGLEIQLSNDVSFQASTSVYGATYVMQSKHLLGDTIFGMDADSGAILMQRNPIFMYQPIGGSGIPALPVPYEGTIDFSAFWTAM